MFQQGGEIKSLESLSSVPGEPEHALLVLLDFESDDTVEKPDLSEKISVYRSAESDAQKDAVENSKAMEEIKFSRRSPVPRPSFRLTRTPGLWWRLELIVSSRIKAPLGIIEPSSYLSAVNGHDPTFRSPALQKS